MQTDEEAELLAEGAVQADLWGINLYRWVPEEDWLEFDSMSNLRPSWGSVCAAPTIRPPVTRSRQPANNLVRR
jgi:hypothetical protein